MNQAYPRVYFKKHKPAYPIMLSFAVFKREKNIIFLKFIKSETSSKKFKVLKHSNKEKVQMRPFISK